MRPPDFIIGGEQPYLLRWWLLPKNRWINVFLHKILRSDDERALHDHPWWNVSIVLRGGYDEVVPDFSAAWTPYTRLAELPLRGFPRRAGSVIFRHATAAHRLVLPIRDGRTRPCWTLFITGPYQRKWGFHCAKGWIPHEQFVAPWDTGRIGRGCE